MFGGYGRLFCTFWVNAAGFPVSYQFLKLLAWSTSFCPLFLDLPLLFVQVTMRLCVGVRGWLRQPIGIRQMENKVGPELPERR